MNPRSPRRPGKKTSPAGPPPSAGPQRLQKILAAAGFGSRRQCEEMILQGRVEIDRQMVTELGAKADPETQEIRVDGAALPRRRRVYYLLNKPPGILSTNRDPDGRPRVIDLIDSRERLFTVGRLDRSSEGLILVTNDGELAQRLTHPRFGVEKTYQVTVVGSPTAEQMKQMRQGIHLAEGFVRVAHIRIKRRLPKGTVLEIVLDEGRNREIRRMLARLGHKVVQLKRIALGPLRLGVIPLGAYRELTPAEVAELYQAASPGGKRAAAKKHPRSAKKKTARPTRESAPASAESPSVRPRKKGARKKRPAGNYSPSKRSSKKSAGAKKKRPPAGGRKKTPRKGRG